MKKDNKVNNHTLPIGLVVEDECAISAIPMLLKDTGIKLTRPIKFDGQPVQRNESFQVFVENKIVPLVRILCLKSVRLVIVTIDHEQRSDCPGQFAALVEQIIINNMIAKYQYNNSPEIKVVCVEKMLENWLIADPDGIRNNKFITKDLKNRIGQNSDNKNALEIIKEAFPSNRCYDKSIDAPKLASCVRPLLPEVRKRSHSLDKLLRVCGLPPVKNNSN